MREEFSKNLNKFELYAKRNIFTESTGGDDSYNGELEQKIQEVKDEAAKLTDLRQKYADMANECREAEQMLADMKSSLFGMCIVVIYLPIFAHYFFLFCPIECQAYAWEPRFSNSSQYSHCKMQ